MIAIWNISRCRRCAGIIAGLVVAATVGCASDGPPRRTAAAATTDPAAATASDPAMEGWEVAYYSGYFDETLRGDIPAAKRSFESVVASYDADRRQAARAALRLATYAAAEKRRRRALDLVARAAALGGGVPELSDRAQRLQRRLASVSAEDIEVRGPSAGTALSGVSPEAATRFAAAEKLLAAYHRRRPTSRLEQVMGSVRAKRGAADNAAKAYREVIALGEPVATAAAEFRIASVYYDLSLSLRYELASEMERELARSFRGQLSSWALANRRKAQAAYRRALAAARGAAAEPVKRWQQAAVLGLSSVEDLLRPR